MRPSLWLIVVLFFGFGKVCDAQLPYNQYDINDNGNLNLGGYLYHATDTSLQKTIAQMQHSNFKPLGKDKFSKSYLIGNEWLLVNLVNSGPTKTVVLELDNPRINTVDFYLMKNSRTIKQLSTGDSFSFFSRQNHSRNFVFPIAMSASDSIRVFVKVQKQYESLSMNVLLRSESDFNAKEHGSYLFWGIMAGLSLIVLCFNFAIFLATGNDIYLWYLGIILSGAFHLICASGLGFQYIWPDSPAFNSYYPQTFSTWFVIFFQLKFMQHFIGQQAHNSKAYKYVLASCRLILVVFGLSVLVMVLNVFTKWFFPAMLYISLFFNFIILPLAIWSVYEKAHSSSPMVRFYGLVTVFKGLALLVYLFNFVFKIFDFGSLDVVLVNYIFDLIVLALAALYFGFTFYKNENEMLLTTLHQNQQAHSQHIINALEIERGRIAEDLYDDVGAMLSMANNYISAVVRKADVQVKYPILTEAKVLITRAVDNLRSVSHNLMPKNFTELGLAQSVQETLNKLNENDEIIFDFILVGKEKKMVQSVEIQLFRIVTELINDILKNSGATSATIQLIYEADSLVVMAEDNGPVAPLYNNLESKVAFVNGSLSIDTGPQGCTVVIKVPYNEPIN